MQRTIFHSPIVGTLLRWISSAFFRLQGWKIEGSLPSGAWKCVVVAAPHRSAWDLPYTLMLASSLRLHPYWMGKESLFKPLLRALLLWLGGIPIQRDKRIGSVVTYARILRNATDPMQLIISPEGTRKKVHEWRTGFYHIARLADVPIVLAYIDYENKRGGIGKMIIPTDDEERDMKTIKGFYETLLGTKE